VLEINQHLSGELKRTFTEVLKLFELTLTLPSTTVSVERNRIKDYRPTTMGQDRLSKLTLLAIEGAMLQ
jgi:hypothetical protein